MGNWLRGNWKHSENSRIYSVFLKKIALSPAIIQNFAGRRGNKSVQPSKNGWTSLQKATWKPVGETANFRRYNKKRLWHLSHHSLMEVTGRFELPNEGFADPCLTTWPRHHNKQKAGVNRFLAVCLERPTRLELATSTLARLRSTGWATSASASQIIHKVCIFVKTFFEKNITI